MISLLDPDRMIVGGGLLSVGDLWWKTFVQPLRESPLPTLKAVDIVQAQLTDYPQLVGVVQLVLQSDSLKTSTDQA